MPDTTPMRERMIAILKREIVVDASGLAPAVISHYISGFDRAVDAILSELEKPTPEMVEAGFKAAITSDGLKEDDLTVGDVRKAKVTVEMLFTAAIRAAKETK